MTVIGSPAVVLPHLKELDDFLLLSHIHPDGDSIGSLLGLADLLEQIGKTFTIASSDPIPAGYRFLEGATEINVGAEGLRERYDNVIVLDISDPRRTGYLQTYLQSAVNLITVDHHQRNEFIGPKYVRTTACATGELIYELFQEAGIQPSWKGAQALYTAIMTDTGRFSYANTTQESLAIAADLVGLGAEPNSLYEEVYQRKPLEFVKLLGKVLDTLQITCNGRVAYLCIDQKMLADFSIEVGDTEHYISYAQMIEGVEVALLFRELNGSTKISWRSKAAVDVSAFAQNFGGGGHKNAAGCELDDQPQEAIDKILTFLQEQFC